MSKILILGATGQVGKALSLELNRGYETVLASRTGDHADIKLDLEDLGNLEAAILKVRPDIIINAAAYTAVDLAENEAHKAFLINRDAVGVLAAVASTMDAVLFHYSTDYVFDGMGKNSWKETDPTNPINTYGKSKLEGENKILESGCKHYILRTSWVYSSHGSNFVKSILRAVTSGKKSLNVVSDQVGRPTSALTIAKITKKIMESPCPFGTYNVSDTETLSWYEFAKYIADKTSKLSKGSYSCEVKPILSIDYPTLARRPQNSVLSREKLSQSLDLKDIPSWHDITDDIIQSILSSHKSPPDAIS